MGFPSSQVRSVSVSQDWQKPLNNEKTNTYQFCVHTLEAAYTMFSVTLDEAFGMRRTGRSAKAHQLLGVSPTLCSRFSAPMGGLLKSMVLHARHFGTTPNLAPLDPQNFRSSRSQRVARFNELLSRVLLTRKSQFVNKISTLEDLVEELDESFMTTASELLEQESIRPDHDWEAMDAIHYNLNTCLRENAVVYKSFLHALPDAQLQNFKDTLHELCTRTAGCQRLEASHLAHRRIAFLKGQ